MASLKLSSASTARVAAKAPVAKANKFMVWQPTNNKFFETFSYLPPLTDDQIARQVDYIVNNGWTPCLEFSAASEAYTSNANVVRVQNGSHCNYYDNRYWTMWKLPMFGCTDPSQVLKEIASCVKACPDAYVRMAAFDANRQVQVASMLVHRPATAKDWKTPDKRQLA